MVGLVVAVAPTLAMPASAPRFQPYPDAIEYADAAYHLVHGGKYLTYVREPPRRRDRVTNQDPNGPLHPPKYPPGFSLTLVPFVKWAGHYPASTRQASKVFAVLLILAVWGVATLLGGPLSGATAALILGFSPFPRFISRYTMSDGLAALLAVVCLLLVIRFRRIGLAVAGVVAGWSFLVRLTGVVVVGALVWAVRKWRLALIVLMAAAPFVIGLLIYQDVTFGSPFTTGYAHYYPRSHEFSAHFILSKNRSTDGLLIPDQLRGMVSSVLCSCTYFRSRSGGLSNLTMYLATLTGAVWVFAPPLIPLFGVWELFRRIRTPDAQFAIALSVGTLVIYLPYYYQGVRFLGPAGAILVAYAGVGIGRLLANYLRSHGMSAFARGFCVG